MEVNSNQGELPDTNSIAFYIGKDSEDKVFIDYFSLPIRTEAQFIELNHSYRKGKTKPWDICEMQLDSDGDYTVRYFFNGTYRMSGNDTYENYFRYGEAQLKQYLESL